MHRVGSGWGEGVGGGEVRRGCSIVLCFSRGACLDQPELKFCGIDSTSLSFGPPQW